MSPSLWHVVGLTLRTSFLGVLLVWPLGIGLGYWLARSRRPERTLVETLVSLPLVLPPTAVGLILLEVLGQHRPVGRWLTAVWGWEVAFTWKAVALACAVMAFPLIVRSVRAAFEGVDPRLEQMGRSLGRGAWTVFFRVTLPLAARGLLAGTILGFSRALGEFGATIVVAGNIPGRTQTLALSIFQNVQTGHDAEALQAALITVVIAFAAIWMSEKLVRGGRP